MEAGRLNRDLARAVDLFVMTKFQECFDECKDVIAVSKMEAEQERNDVIIEAATALGIQALAEIDRWMETTSFIINVYGKVERVPPRIIQVCILLHAHVKEFLPCHHLVQTWLRKEHNLRLKQSGQVIRVYATHVLCPTGCQNVVKEIVDKCVSLTQSEKDVLLKQSLSKVSSIEYESIRRVSVTSESEEHTTDKFYRQGSQLNRTSLSTPDTENSPQQPPSSLHGSLIDGPASWIQDKAIEVFQNVCHFLSEKSSILRSNSYIRLAFTGLVAILALLHSQTDVLSLSRVVMLWRHFLHRVSVMLRFKSN